MVLKSADACLRETAHNDIFVAEGVVQGKCLKADLHSVYEADAGNDRSCAEGKRNCIERPATALPLQLVLLLVQMHVLAEFISVLCQSGLLTSS